MRSKTNNVRRATQDLDIDFIKYSLADESIDAFIDKLNCLDGIKISRLGKIEELKQQDYSGKGTTNNPSSRNHRLYCIQLERLFLNIRLAIKRIPMIPLINTLHIKKRIIKSATLIASFF